MRMAGLAQLGVFRCIFPTPGLRTVQLEGVIKFSCGHGLWVMERKLMVFDLDSRQTILLRIFPTIRCALNVLPSFDLCLQRGTSLRGLEDIGSGASDG